MNMRALELKVPPVALLFLTAVIIWVSIRILPVLTLAIPFPWVMGLASIFVTAGGLFVLFGVIAFRSADTTMNPIKPDSTSSLVHSGIYALTRNPMYFGFLLILIGWCVYLSNATAALFVPLYVLYMNRFQIEPEERVLEQMFGQDFTTYKAKVRRWI
jgi:protein-S-isoprenylcysteine O-methyltransferase Ste14